jgi:hypothetical protein
MGLDHTPPARPPLEAATAPAQALIPIVPARPALVLAKERLGKANRKVRMRSKGTPVILGLMTARRGMRPVTTNKARNRDTDMAVTRK